MFYPLRIPGGDPWARKVPAVRLATLVAALLVTAASVAAQSADDRYPFVKNGKVGFINSEGREVIPAQFSNAGDSAHFQEGLAPVAGAEGAGYIDPSGKFVIGPQSVWGSAQAFREGVASVLIWGKNGALNTPALIDRSGKIIYARGEAAAGVFSEGLMPLSVKGKWGFVDKSFQMVIPPQFDWAFAFSEGLASVQIGRKWGFVDKSGRVVIPPKYDLASQFRDGLARVRYDIPDGTVMTEEGRQTARRHQYGFIDHEGNEVIPPQFAEATYFSEGYAMASPPNSKLLGIIDKTGNFVHEPEFESGSEFHEGLAAAGVNGKYGYIDTSGSWVIAPTLSHAGDFWHGLARVGWRGGAEYGYINKRGEAVWKNTRDGAGAGGSASPRAGSK
jgi:hypothetical protein